MNYVSEKSTRVMENTEEKKKKALMLMLIRVKVFFPQLSWRSYDFLLRLSVWNDPD
jgi:hypothetical protein